MQIRNPKGNIDKLLSHGYPYFIMKERTELSFEKNIDH